MRFSNATDPILSFPIPDGAPAPVLAALEKFDRLALRYAELKGERQDEQVTSSRWRLIATMMNWWPESRPESSTLPLCDAA
jgi:hypothetical protein